MSLKLHLFSLSPIVALLLFSECKKKNDVDPVNDYLYSTSHSLEGISYLALGDSYTKAECEVISNSYPTMLVNKMKEKGCRIKSQTIVAKTGWRTDNLMNAVDNLALKDTFDLVSLLIGVNNQYQGRSTQEYRTQFRMLLEKSIALAKGKSEKVFVVSIPDYGVTPFGSGNEAYISSQIDVFNAINKEITDSLGVKYFDITPISREAKTDQTLTCTDHLHPSAKMYARWVDLMFDDVFHLVKKP